MVKGPIEILPWNTGILPVLAVLADGHLDRLARLRGFDPVFDDFRLFSALEPLILRGGGVQNGL